MKLTYIEWEDCFGPTDAPWYSTQDERLNVSSPLVIVSVGFVVRENEHFVVLANSADHVNCSSGDFEDTQVSGVMAIPQRQISKRVEIDVAKAVERAPKIEWVRKGRRPTAKTL